MGRDNASFGTERIGIYLAETIPAFVAVTVTRSACKVPYGYPVISESFNHLTLIFKGNAVNERKFVLEALLTLIYIL